MSPLKTWLFIAPLALVCYGVTLLVVCKALGSRSADYPRPRSIKRSNMALHAGGHNDLRKVVTK